MVVSPDQWKDDPIGNRGDAKYYVADESDKSRVFKAFGCVRIISLSAPLRVNTVYGMLRVVRAGLGMSVLPCYLGEKDSRLVWVGGPIPSIATGQGIVTHPDLRRTERIRVFLDHVGSSARMTRFGLPVPKAPEKDG